MCCFARNMLLKINVVTIVDIHLPRSAAGTLIAAQVVAIVVNSILRGSVPIRARQWLVICLLALAGRDLNNLNQESLFICLDSLDFLSPSGRTIISRA